MSPARVVWLTARREVRARMATRAYRIGTALLVVLIVASAVIINALGGGGADRIGLTDRDAGLAASVQATAEATGADVETVTVSDGAAGEAQVRDGDLDAFIVEVPRGLRAIVEEDLNDELRATLSAVARQRELDAQIAQLGGDPAAVNRDLAAATVTVRSLDPAQEFAGERLVVGMIVGVLVYLALLVYGQTVSQGVVEEKTSRVVELLLSSIRAWQLMAGKVLGIGLTALLQLVLVLGAGVAAGLATGALDMPASIAVGTVVWSVVWFVLGFFLYAILFAAAGALVSRQEDVGGVTLPLTMAIVLPYVIGVTVLPGDPDSGLVAILSIIPLFAPMLMPMRLAIGGVPALEVVIAIALIVVLTALLVWLAGRIYTNAVMRVGARVNLRDALRSA